eukprot:gene30338-39567_t
MASINENLQKMETFLLTVEESHFLAVSMQHFVVLLEICDVGSWVIKYSKKMGLIVNNRDIVLPDLINVDASFWFKSHSHFIEMVQFNAQQEGCVKITGQEEVPVKDVAATSPPPPLVDTANTSNAAIILNRGAGPRLPVLADGSQPLKAGWLLKKRDILSGWRCRYFVVYKGRVEYYVDQHDLQPRQVLSLAGAEVQPYKRVSVNGMGEYWGLSIETKYKEQKLFRLASELTGVEGSVEASSWETVFREASKVAPELMVRSAAAQRAAAGRATSHAAIGQGGSFSRTLSSRQSGRTAAAGTRSDQRTSASGAQGGSSSPGAALSDDERHVGQSDQGHGGDGEGEGEGVHFSTAGVVLIVAGLVAACMYAMGWWIELDVALLAAMLGIQPKALLWGIGALGIGLGLALVYILLADIKSLLGITQLNFL